MISMLLTFAMAQNVVVVVSDDLPPYQAPVPAFVETMGGQPRIIQLEGRESVAEAELAALRSNPPDVVLALGAKAAFATRFRLPSTPLVYTSVLDPDRYGIAGPQVTGVGARVEPVTYLSQVAAFFPSLKTVGVIRSTEASEQTVTELVSAGDAVGLKVVVRQVDSPRTFRREMHQLAAETDAVWVSAERGILTPEGFRGAVQELRRRGKPLLADTVNMVGAGAAFAVVPDLDGVGRQAAGIAERIVGGSAPSVIPAEAPRELTTAVNLRTLEEGRIAHEVLMLDFAQHTFD